MSDAVMIIGGDPAKAVAQLDALALTQHRHHARAALLTAAERLFMQGIREMSWQQLAESVAVDRCDLEGGEATRKACEILRAARIGDVGWLRTDVRISDMLEALRT